MNWNNFVRVSWAALVATVVLVPAMLALCTVVIYLTGLAGEDSINILEWSLFIAIVAWFLAAFFYRSLATAEYSIPSSFCELQVRLTKLKAVFEALDVDNGTIVRWKAARTEVEKQLKEIDEELKQPGLQWVLARGYVNVWDRMYRAEEALIEVAPQEMVLAGALYDELRLQGSTIDNCEDLLVKLRQAVIAIDSNASQYLKPSAPVTKQLAINTTSPLPERTVNEDYNQRLYATGGTPPYSWKFVGDKQDGLDLDPNTGALRVTKPEEAKEYVFTMRVTDKAGLMMEKTMTLPIKGTARDAAETSADTKPETVALAVLRTVRRSINEYRGGSWGGLIVARNRLLGAMILTAVTAYTLLAIAIICKPPPHVIVAASVFYLVGATAGLFSRLRSQSQADTAVEDYGLSAARLVTIPVFSGLAAIGGVVLVAMAPYINTVFGPSTPTSSPPAIITPSSLPAGIVNAHYNQPLQATGGTPPYRWEIIGDKLDGLDLDKNTGVLSGIQKEVKKYSFTVRVIDKAGLTMEKPLTLTIKGTAERTGPTPETKKQLAAITKSPLPEGSVDAAYKQPFQASGGTPPYSWEIIGEKPDGLVVDQKTGELTGMPTTAETSKFEVQVTDKTGTKERKKFILAIKPSLAGGTATQSVPPLLRDIFNLDKFLLALLIAAMFGLTPELLFDSLLKQTEKLKNNLKSSEATREHRRHDKES